MSILAAVVVLAGIQVSSPDGHLVVNVTPGRLTYSIELDGKPLVSPSPMGLGFADGSSIGPRVQILKTVARRHRGVWEDAFGTSRKVRDDCNEVRLTLRDGQRTFDVILRAYDQGAAFRYSLPEGGFTVTQDNSEFRFPSDAPAWGGQFSTSAEVQYPETRLSALPDKNACLPVVVRAPSAFVAISESDLLDWSGMFLRRSAEGFGVRASLASNAVGSGPKQSPWRVLMIGRTAADLVSNHLIKNLASPSRIGDTSWIKPGITAWDPWWTGANPSLPQFRGLDARGDTTAHKRYIDFASEMGWPYQLVDWLWYDMGSRDPETAIKPTSSIDMPELLRYAKSKGVRLILWVHSKDVTRMGADRLFAVYESWGAAGVKIDFMDSDSQDTVRWYEETLAAAARHHLLVNFHGAYKPTGLARTYPNYITQEGVLGNEYNKLPGERFSPKQMITLPFTRGLLGPADVTPGGFLNRTPEEFRTGAIPTQVMGTRTRQLALAVLMESPLLCLCDAPENYRGQPGIEFYRNLPTVWDESRVLDAEFAQRLVIARRKGNDWWVVGINADQSTSMEFPLAFLGKGRYRLELFADGADLTSVRETKERVRSSGKLRIQMNANGGFAARILFEGR